MERIRLHIAAIALGLLLILVGHDTLMATDPHVPGHVGHHGMNAGAAGSRMAAGPHASDHVAHRGMPTSEPDVDCGQTTGAPLRPSHGPDIDGSAMAQVPPQHTLEAAGFSPNWSVDPDHPSATRRALLQVYLN